MKKNRVVGVGEARRGREDLSDEERPGKLPTTGFSEILVDDLERDRQTTARRLVTSLGISP
jgi:hypothetical protein